MNKKQKEKDQKLKHWKVKLMKWKKKIFSVINNKSN